VLGIIDRTGNYIPIAAGLIIVAIPCAITGMINNRNHREYREDAIRYYNLKY